MRLSDELIKEMTSQCSDDELFALQIACYKQLKENADNRSRDFYADDTKGKIVECRA